MKKVQIIDGGINVAPAAMPSLNDDEKFHLTANVIVSNEVIKDFLNVKPKTQICYDPKKRKYTEYELERVRELSRQTDRCIRRHRGNALTKQEFVNTNNEFDDNVIRHVDTLKQIYNSDTAKVNHVDSLVQMGIARCDVDYYFTSQNTFFDAMKKDFDEHADTVGDLIHGDGMTVFTFDPVGFMTDYNGTISVTDKRHMVNCANRLMARIGKTIFLKEKLFQTIDEYYKEQTGEIGYTRPANFFSMIFKTDIKHYANYSAYVRKQYDDANTNTKYVRYTLFLE